MFPEVEHGGWKRARDSVVEFLSDEEAKRYEKSALEHGSPFTWSQGESLSDLERPERIAQIEADFDLRRFRERAARKTNPLRILQEKNSPEDIDSIYMEDEGNGACLVCHK